MRRSTILAVVVLLLVVGLAIAARSIVVADETQFVLVTSFGRPVALYGDEPGEAGPHPRWPWQGSWAIDRRLRSFDAAPREVITGDKKNLEVAGFVAWKVADPVAFLRAAGSGAAAEARLEERVASALSDAIGRRELASLASTDPDVWSLDDLTAEIRLAVDSPARRELGVEVVDVRLRRFNHPLEVRPAVFDLIRSERRQVAAQLRADGEAQYRTITSRADREREAILAEADAEAERIRATGEAEATRLLNEAHAVDPGFAEFLRTLETYRALLDGRATVVLSAESPLLRLLHEGPGPGVLEPPAAASPTPMAGSPSAAEAPGSSPGGGDE
ncbi:protease modulator HflC [Tautonia plasticadhaerens]|uniref:Protein HflC n=1 Tax=Tautonia plasticadhaerens TaxID=2527974 RepID=A0A518GX58_9BACT|nr:protease modulator HflC [Tautonia plasticadhaerens]QDV33160.1 Modulator of FtsH protease HflC [Tautonia plasticadhaerens]